MKAKLLKILTSIFGNSDELILEHRIANIIWFFAALMGFVTTIINIALGLSLSLILTTILFFILQICFYFIAKLNKNLFNIIIQITILTFISIIVFGWISEGGSSGAWESILFSSLILSIILSKGKLKIYIIILHIITVVILMLIEQQYPNIINYYTSQNQRFIDLTSTYLFMIAFLGLAMFLYSTSYTSMNKKLYHSNIEIKEKNNLIEKELLMARQIQKKLIPDQSPANYISTFYKSMTQVGGDFFDFFYFRDSPKIGIFISDVSGHGVPAALITSMVKSFVFENARRKQNPAQLLSHLNKTLIKQVGEHFITAFYGIYDPFEKSFLYSNAGHEPPLLILDSKITELPTNKSTALAILDNDGLEKKGLEYKNTSIQFNKEKKLILFTDGLTEASHKNDRYNFFGHKMLQILLYKFRDIPGDKLIENLYNQLVTFTGKEIFDDDICMIVVDL